MLPRVLLIDNHDSFTYNLVQLLDESRMCSFVVVKNDELYCIDPKGFNKILISPGPGVPSEVPAVRQLILHYAKSKSILGICLGLQAITEAFGGQLVNLGRVRHGMQCRVSFCKPIDPLFRNLGDRITAGLYHSWAVDRYTIPDGFRVTAVDPEGVVMALSHDIYDVKGVQFHPESYMTEKGSTIIHNWLSDY